MRNGTPPLLAVTAAVAGVAELTLLRLATRTFVNIPGLDEWAPVLDAIAEAGRVAYFVTVAALIAILYGSLRQAQIKGDRAGMARRLAVAGFVITALALRIGAFGVGTSVVASVAVLIVLVSVVGDGRARIPVRLFGLAVLSGGAALALGLGADSVSAVATASEAVGVGAAVSAPLLMRGRFRRWPVAGGVVAGVLAAGALGSIATPVRVLTLWAFGASGFLPVWTYALSVCAVVATILEALARRNWPVASGLALIGCGGFAVVSTYQTGLAVVGLLLVAEGMRPAVAEPTPEAAPLARV